MAIAPGARLGPYMIVEALASGGMGDVYAALDTRLERRVALKVLPQGAAEDSQRLLRFEQEARSASALNHPNIVTIYDVGVDQARHYIAMELIEGRTIRALVESGPLSAPHAARIAAQVAVGLAKAHDAGIAHRDLKPENVMVTPDGYVKILDFGLAKLSTPSATAVSGSDVMTIAPSPTTNPGVVLGTVGYMSPEQAKGLPSDAPADQFALGAILYEMLTGDRAFPGRSSIEVLAGIVRDTPRALPGIQPPLGAIVSRCLAKKPDERFPSARVLAEALEGAMRDLAAPAVAGPGPPSPVTAMFGLDSSIARASSQPAQSIAVLPFADLSPEHDQEYFCDGLADELISDLGSLDGARVASRTASFQFKGQSLDVAEIGRRLNVGSILEGSVRKAGNRVRITVQLTSVQDGYQLWSERYNRDMDDIFAIQDEIAKAILGKLTLHLAHGNATGMLTLRARRRPDDPEAYHEYLRGRFYWNKRTASAFQQAVHHFERAVERAPDYAMAHAGLADTFNVLGYYNVLPPRNAYPRAKAASARALEADPGLAEAHASLGFSLLFFDRDWDGAERSLREAIALETSYPSAHQWLAWVLFVRGRFGEALESMRRAHDLDPLSPVIGCHLAYSLALVGRRAEAIDHLRSTLLLDPAFPLAHWFLGSLRLSDDRAEDAIQSFRSAVEASDGRVGLGYLGRAYAQAGRRADAVEVLARLERDAGARFVSPLEAALVHAGLGDLAAAFEALERAFEERVSDLSRLNLLDWPGAVCADPRYASLLARLDLPAAAVT